MADICFVCEKKITWHDDYEWFGLDGDKIHKKCAPKVMIICGFALGITYFIQHEKILAVCWTLIAIFKTLETAIHFADDFDDLNEDR